MPSVFAVLQHLASSTQCCSPRPHVLLSLRTDKPTHGVVFAEYLTRYSHWSYTDIDMLIGDLPLHIEREELEQFDIFTYHFGDVFRLYLRGQFAAHRNSEKVNALWAQCPHLGSGCACACLYDRFCGASLHFVMRDAYTRAACACGIGTTRRRALLVLQLNHGARDEAGDRAPPRIRGQAWTYSLHFRRT